MKNSRHGFILASLLACTPAFAADVVTVDTGSVGRDSSIAIGPDGLPAIAYQNGGSGTVEFARCEDAGCASAVRDTIDDAGGSASGEYLSLGFSANGHPLVAFYDTDADDLAIARCANADCSGEEILRTLDASLEDTGREASMVLDASGRPLVAYVNTTDHSLQLARCDTPSCVTASVTEVDANSGTRVARVRNSCSETTDSRSSPISIRRRTGCDWRDASMKPAPVPC